MKKALSLSLSLTHTNDYSTNHIENAFLSLEIPVSTGASSFRAFVTENKTKKTKVVYRELYKKCNSSVMGKRISFVTARANTHLALKNESKNIKHFRNCL